MSARAPIDTVTVSAVGRDDHAWDPFVRAQDGWTHCHLLGWRRVLEDVFGHECLSLVARDQTGAVEGVLPLVRVRSLLFGHYLVSMPFVNYGGPLGSGRAVRALAAEALARADGADLVELRSRAPLPLDLPVSHRKITVVLDLPLGDADTLWSGLGAKVRSQVKRPRKEGVDVRFGPDQLRPFYTVLARHMRDLGTPVLPRRFFTAVLDTFPGDVRLACGYLRGQPVACGLGFRWNDEFEMTWASSLREHNRLAPNMLVYWSFMERCVEEGVGLFNFGRCTPGGGTHRFKRQWGGARDQVLHWYHDGAGKRAATPSPDEGAYAWGPRVWRRLPVSLATALGPHIVRNIP